MKILGIETSCDETAVAVVEDGVRILSNVIASQVELHARYGGIVPEVASRQHLLATIPILQKALVEAQVELKDISAIAVTNGPGLAGSLLVGVNLAKSLALAYGLPIIGINHLEGHIYANWLEEAGRDGRPEFPLLCLIVSGGHTDLILMTGHGEYRQLGQTRDDAAGEAFDKVARLLGLGYPGGPVIEQASKGVNNPRRLPRAWLKGSDDFSFSGLKTAVLHLGRDSGIEIEEATSSSRRLAAEIAAGFQESVVDVLVTKTTEAARNHGVKQILLAGGVAANDKLRQTMMQRTPVPVLIPAPILCTDNAAMIAACGYFRLMAGKTSGWDLDVKPSLKLA
ncbi:MAG: tRNA (adenosine(37)-N6)-threonylcarbamoyltransferase complex transferase subunit TsaD [Chloroflexi bacterium CG07_land_8_20_14_0_80_51_10]|nr:MAG: tRNA (adenosine(37)-N6)-threonylcarbamoyltransferase complex transferase subunit TsaD [Chloroflexi bacterium CG07_land_8_20_14_0_80_51_10]